MSEPFDTDDPEAALRQLRASFMESFDERLRSLDLLVDEVVVRGAIGPLETLRKQAHRLAGLAGTIGFPSVSERAAEIEQLALTTAPMQVERTTWRDAIDRLQAAFRSDAAEPPPSWALAPTEREHRILVIEDDDAQRTVMATWLKAAGYLPVGVASAEDGLMAATDERPDAIILDVDLPGVDGYAFCRALKASTLASVPVMFVTARTDEQDRAFGLALGADDYLQKPIDAEQLTLRLGVMLGRAQAPDVAAPAGTGVSALPPYDSFLPAARDLLQQGAASLALIRVPEGADLTPVLDGLRPRDLKARYRAGYVVLLLPRRATGQVVSWLRDALRHVRGRDETAACAGVAGTGAPGQLDLETLLADADEALARARQAGLLAATRADRDGGPGGASQGRIVVAEDEPSINRVLDTQLRAAGYETISCANGQTALDAVLTRRPNLLILDLMMPGMTGFDLLEELRRRGAAKPRVLVLSASGRADDVRRAVALGADDYVIKPFKPIEIAVRVRRLLS
ncbi:MAG: response regulator [Acidobacteriota bacterium]|nr:response regulator [Acidobacteriota bacterium]